MNNETEKGLYVDVETGEIEIRDLTPEEISSVPAPIIIDLGDQNG